MRPSCRGPHWQRWQARQQTHRGQGVDDSDTAAAAAAALPACTGRLLLALLVLRRRLLLARARPLLPPPAASPSPPIRQQVCISEQLPDARVAAEAAGSRGARDGEGRVDALAGREDVLCSKDIEAAHCCCSPGTVAAAAAAHAEAATSPVGIKTKGWQWRRPPPHVICPRVHNAAPRLFLLNANALNRLATYGEASRMHQER